MRMFLHHRRQTLTLTNNREHAQCWILQSRTLILTLSVLYENEVNRGSVFDSKSCSTFSAFWQGEDSHWHGPCWPLENAAVDLLNNDVGRGRGATEENVRLVSVWLQCFACSWTNMGEYFTAFYCQPVFSRTILSPCSITQALQHLLSRVIQVVVARDIGKKLSSVIQNHVCTDMKRNTLQLWQTACLLELKIGCDTFRGFGRPAFPDAEGRLSMRSPVGVLYSIVPLHHAKGPRFPFQCGPRDACSQS